MRKIVVRGAREHNLKNLYVEIPKDSFVVITGPSGSGKSSLAFDTIYAEGQRRYVESLSAYARQFLELMEKPDVDSIDGLSPAIAIEQKTISKNPRSTVGTQTEVYDYLRLLFARVGQPYCYGCGREIRSQPVQEIADLILNMPHGTRLIVLAPIVRGRKGEYKKELEALRRGGFSRVRVDGELHELDEPIELDKNKKHSIAVVVDRLVIGEVEGRRCFEAVETAFKLTKGLVELEIPGQKNQTFSESYACPDCGISYPEVSPRLFSFNDPFGACPECSGLGSKMALDPALVTLNPESSLEDGAIPAFFRIQEGKLWLSFTELSKKYRIPLDKPWVSLSKAEQDVVLYGKDGFEGVLAVLERRMAYFPQLAEEEGLTELVAYVPCGACRGKRLKKEALWVRLGGENIADACAMPIQKTMDWLLTLDLTQQQAKISERILKEIKLRLTCLIELGLGYLTLDRASRTLSGGEGQRIRLASQLGSGLSGVLYVLDEPSIGLHSRDNVRLLKILKGLRDLGNTVLVVEHDRDTIESADYVLDLGPGAGEHGGQLVFAGRPGELKASGSSITADYLALRKRIPIPQSRRKGTGKRIVLRGVRKHNIKGITFEIQLGTLTCIAGVSGSGKSTLVVDVLVPALKSALLLRRTPTSDTFEKLEGVEHVDRLTVIDQSPIGRTPRSNPATYTGVFTVIRELFAQLPESRSRGFRPGRFSFNVKGGRCEACHGEGLKRIEMHFLPDVHISCEVCSGSRFNQDTLNVLYNGKNIAEVLDMTVEEAVGFFSSIPPLKRKLETLMEVGMGYIRLGQSATTLSGGEAQRLKLSRELGRKATGRTLYVFDEPTTGLHFVDIAKLLKVIQRLVDQGNTAIVIEHNLEVLKCADLIVDLGPEGGEDGGLIVAQGTPEAISQTPNSETGKFLRRLLEQEACSLF